MLVRIKKFEGNVEALRKFFEGNGFPNVVSFLNFDPANKSDFFLHELQEVMIQFSRFSEEEKKVIEARYEGMVSTLMSLKTSKVSDSLRIANMVIDAEKAGKKLTES